MRTLAALLVAGIALGTGGRDAPPVARPPGIQLADMGMGAAGPQLGGSQDDMVLDDPGHLPAEADMVTSDPGHVPEEADMDVSDPGHLPPEANMIVTDPGFVPREAQMDVDTPRDDDQQDDITE
jgi:hypothetical protein